MFFTPVLVRFLHLIVFSLLCCLFPRFLWRPSSPTFQNPTISLTPWQSLTAVLPVTEGALSNLNASLITLLHDTSSCLAEIIVFSPEDIAPLIRQTLRRTLSLSIKHHHPDITLRLLPANADTSRALLRITPDISTEWIVVLDGHSVVSSRFLPKSFIPWDPSLSLDAPLVLHKSLLLQSTNVSRQSASALRGRTYFLASENGVAVPNTLNAMSHSPKPPLSSGQAAKDASITFSVVLPTISDLKAVSTLLCKLQKFSNEIRILLFDEVSVGSTLRAGKCALGYDVLTSPGVSNSGATDVEAILEWLTSFSDFPDIILSLKEASQLCAFLETDVSKALLPDAFLIRIPRQDLPYTEWMASFTLPELRSWYTPRVDLSIITRSRPDSFQRLLGSLTNARLFGDKSNLRINLESDSDAETLRVARDFSWPHGEIFVHHRIVRGGLLPAVVESWYPRDNHSFSIVLEDDVELSPLFYAWVKMAILRYRYGHPKNQSSTLFGISLYQQKNLELPPQGRRPFNPRALFSEVDTRGLPPHTPYLSQIPCSWGAVYFPEHWREFHDFLSLRFSGSPLPLHAEIVPDVRSNRWRRSWKRYFIELAYLRGYTMLYPNFEGFLSFSTNHLEVGDHVKVRSPEKKELFMVPLIELSDGPATVDNVDLPSLDRIPRLNLTGEIVSQNDMADVGLSRRNYLFQCIRTQELVAFDALSLMCIDLP